MNNICTTCGKTFYARPSEVAVGWGKYCSVKCRSIDIQGPKHPLYGKPRPDLVLFNKSRKLDPIIIRKHQSEYNAKYYQNHKDEILVRIRAWASANKDRKRVAASKLRREIKREVLGHYAGGDPKCVCCGETILEFLTIDHLNGGGSRQREQLNCRRNTISFFRWLRKNGYPSGYQTLCMNCNSAKSWWGECPHKRIYRELPL